MFLECGRLAAGLSQDADWLDIDARIFWRHAMKKWMVWTIALTALIAVAMEIPNAEKITGKWQGALKVPNGQLRIVIEILSDSGKLKANFYSIDQRSPAIPASTVAWDGSTLKMTIAALNGNYEGRLSADGNSISGTWSQGGPPMPLDLARATPETAWAIPEPPPPPRRMAADANPEFEVATIKPSNLSRPGKLFTIRGSDVITINTTLSDLPVSLTNALLGPVWAAGRNQPATS
jgi:hypothetical protein